MARPTVVCLTPVKNESWILERFLKCASLWADHIIVADQNSDDGSREIAGRFPKVRLILNESPEYNEELRTRLLLEEARKIPGPRFLLALDADEFLTSNFLTDDEWDRALNQPPGTVIRLDWANIGPGMTHYWLTPDKPAGFLDNGGPFEGAAIHSPRVPTPADAPSLLLEDIKVLHYQYADWDRMRSKHRWYQLWEKLRDPGLSPRKLFRTYHHMYSVSEDDLSPIPVSWIDGYMAHGVDMTTSFKDPVYWWDKEALGFFQEHGAGFFSKLDVWDHDWVGLADRLGLESPQRFKDPRSAFEKLAHAALRASQAPDRRLFRMMVDVALTLTPHW